MTGMSFLLLPVLMLLGRVPAENSTGNNLPNERQRRHKELPQTRLQIQGLGMLEQLMQFDPHTSWPSESAEMCRGFLFYMFWRLLLGIFLEEFSGQSLPQNEENKSSDKVREKNPAAQK